MNNGRGITDRLFNVTGSFFHISTLVKRFDAPDGNFMREMHLDNEISTLVAMLSDAMADSELDCLDLQKSFEKFSHLWTTDRAANFKAFQEDAQITTELEQKLLDLAKYDKEIARYTDLGDNIKNERDFQDVGWLRVDCRPIKTEIITLCQNWRAMFVDRLSGYLAESLTSLDGFMATVSKGLDVTIDEKSPEAKEMLMGVMRNIRDVKKKDGVTKEVFEPLRDCVALLKTHGRSLSNEQKIGRAHV